MAIHHLILLFSIANQEFKPARRRTEKKFKRKSFVFDDNEVPGAKRYKRKKFPWQATVNNQAAIDEACDHLKCPADWPKVFRTFSESTSMKIADALAFCGDRGCYFLGQMDIAVKVRVEFQAALNALGSFLLKVYYYFHVRWLLPTL